MKKLSTLIVLSLVVLLCCGYAESHAANKCGSTVTVGAGSICGPNRDEACDYSDWAYAISECIDRYTHNLTFQLYDYVDDEPAYITSGYQLYLGSTYYTLKLAGMSWEDESVHGKWDTGRFRSEVRRDTPGGYALYVNLGAGDVVLDNLQFKVNITDDWVDGNGVLLLKGAVTLKNSFIWMVSGPDETFSGKGTAIKIISDGTYNLNNVVIYGDRRRTDQSTYGFFYWGVWTGTYTGAINVRNMTLYGRGVELDPPPQQGEPEEVYRAFAGGVYRREGFALNVSNSYISVNGPCTSGAGYGDYNLCNGVGVVGANSQDAPDKGTDVFLGPHGGYPDFRIKDANSVLNGNGHTSANHTNFDIEDDERPTHENGHVPMDVGVDEAF